jgi:hypothetical protein
MVLLVKRKRRAAWSQEEKVISERESDKAAQAP